MLGTLIGFFVGLGVGGFIVDVQGVDIISPMDSAVRWTQQMGVRAQTAATMSDTDGD